jgi:divalent metal cation (Fe/Co/Zn/Cd) transporter
MSLGISFAVHLPFIWLESLAAIFISLAFLYRSSGLRNRSAPV